MEAKLNKGALILAVLGVILSASVGAWALSVDSGFNSRGGNSQEGNLALLFFGCCALIVVIYAWGFVRAVKRLTPEGVERRDGSKIQMGRLEGSEGHSRQGQGAGEHSTSFQRRRVSVAVEALRQQLRIVEKLPHQRGEAAPGEEGLMNIAVNDQERDNSFRAGQPKAQGAIGLAPPGQL